MDARKDHGYMIEMVFSDMGFSNWEKQVNVRFRAPTLGEAFMQADRWAHKHFPGKVVSMNSFRTGYGDVFPGPETG